MMIDLTRLIPPAVQQMAIDATIDFVAEKGKDLLSNEVSNKIASLRSDYGFQSAFKAGLQRAIVRFITEYSHEDEDLTDALTADSHLFEDKAVQATMLKILQHPGNPQNVAEETLVQSFDRVLPSRRNRERVNKAVAYFLKCLAEEVYHLPELRPLYELQFQRVTAESAREQVALQKAQLEATAAMSQDLRSVLLQLTEAVVQQRLLPAPIHQDLQGFRNLAGLGNLAGLPKLPRHNLPQPDYQRFVGRKEQLKRLGDLLSPKHRAWVVTIDGIGGIGKSALALEVADSYRRLYDKLPPTERFEAIIWTTAKLTVLTGQGIITRSQSLRTLDDIYSTIAVVLQREDITRARPADQDEIVRQALSRQRTLLIVDNLETVDDERVMAFLRDVPSPTKVIVTTRHRLDVAYPIRVVGMTQEEALHLIADQAQLKGIDFVGANLYGRPTGQAQGIAPTLLPEQAQKLFERTGGVPLAMVWSVAQMAFGYGVEAVLTRLGQPNNDVARFCFEAAIERIKDKPAYKLLLALSLFATDASREALGFVADLPELDRDDGLVELEKLSLVNKEGARFGLLPLTKVLAKGELNEKTVIEDTFQLRFIHHFLNFCKNFGGDKWDSYHHLDIELQNIQLAMDWVYNSKNWLEVGEFSTILIDFLQKRGLWNELVEYSERAIEAGVATNNKQLIMNHKMQGVGWANALRFRDHAGGLALILEGKKLALELGDEQGYGIALRREGFVYQELGNYNKARELFQNSLNIWRKLKNKRWEIRTLGSIGSNERNSGNLDKACEYYLEAIKEAEKIGDLEQIGLNSRRFSNALWRKGEFEKAYSKATEALQLLRQVGHVYELALCHLILAKIEYSLGKILESKISAEITLEKFTQLKTTDIEEAQELLNAITQSPNDPSTYLAKCGVHGY